MRIVPITLILCGLARPAFAATASMDSTQAIARARELRAALALKDTERLWQAFGDRMKTAIGNKEKFGGVVDAILAQTGKPLSCPSETASRTSGLWVVHSQCTFEKSKQPLNVEFAFDDEGKVAGFQVKPDVKPYPTTHENDSTKTVLHLPFHGTWTVFWGGKTMDQNYHVVARDQRFAYDIVITKDRLTHTGEGKRNEDHYCWGQPILAPAAGTVTLAVDGIPDNSPGATNATQKAGNHVILDHGTGEWSLFAHFQRGTLRVKPGQKVAEGDTLGLCGNSGNSSEPHLHYHLQDGPTFGDAEGLPAQFVDYVADDKPVARGIPVRGQVIRRAP